jgi:hypothetical protein
MELSPMEALSYHQYLGGLARPAGVLGFLPRTEDALLRLPAHLRGYCQIPDPFRCPTFALRPERLDVAVSGHFVA